MVTITVGSKTVLAQIVDRVGLFAWLLVILFYLCRLQQLQCVSCGPEDLDFSPSLFHHFGGTETQGVMHGTWNFGGEESKPVPTTTTTPKPKPSSTSTSILPPSTTSEPSKTSTSSSSPSSFSSSSSPDVAAPVPTGVLAQSLLALGDLGGLVLAAWTAR